MHVQSQAHPRGRALIAFFITLALMGATGSLSARAQAAAKPTDAQTTHDDHHATSTSTQTHKNTPSVVGWLKLSGSLREGPAPLAWLASSQTQPSLSDVLTQLRHVATGDQYEGVVIYLDQPELRLTQIQAIRQAMQKVHDAGKRVLVFSDAYDLKGYLLAAGADMILLQHKGEVNLNGLGLEAMYFAGLLDKIGVKADLLQIGKYKGAEEPFTRTGPSPAWDQNMSGLLDDLYAQFIEPIAADRHMSVKAFESLMRDSWTMNDEDYVKHKLVDRLVDRDLTDVTHAEFGDDFTWDAAMGVDSGRQVQSDNPFAVLRLLFEEPPSNVTRTSIAVIHAQGAITSGDSRTGQGPLGAQTIGSRTLVKTLGDARDNDLIKGAVIQLDSPGGSALASEEIWQAIRAFGKKKPIYAVVGPMAASGGYYIACATDQIYVQPGSIVGSIGVVGGKVVLAGLYQKLGIHVTQRSRGPLGGMFSSVAPFTESQRKIVHASMVRVYDQFKDRVSIGRGDRLKDVDTVAAGRLFTGREAIKNGMADHRGTVRQAILAMAHDLHLKKGSYDIVHLPPPLSLGEFLQDMLGVHARGPHVASRAVLGPGSVHDSLFLHAARRLLGPQAWASATQVLSGLMQLRTEPVLVLDPVAIVLR